MEYNIIKNTLLIKGKFEALSSGVNGGRASIASIVNHQVKRDFDHQPVEYLNNLMKTLHAPLPYFGLLTAVSMDKLCIMREDYLTTFVTAGISNPSSFRIGTINIILVIKGVLSEGAMVGAVITATEAKAMALIDLGYDFLGTTTDAVVVAYEKHPQPYIEYAGSATDFGKKIIKTVSEGIKNSLHNSL